MTLRVSWEAEVLGFLESGILGHPEWGSRKAVACGLGRGHCLLLPASVWGTESPVLSPHTHRSLSCQVCPSCFLQRF